jgi:hypothetical protein
MSKVIEIDASTNEVTERDFTAEELAQFKEDAKEKIAIEAAKKKASLERQVILDRLGLTADEAALLLG